MKYAVALSTLLLTLYAQAGHRVQELNFDWDIDRVHLVDTPRDYDALGFPKHAVHIVLLDTRGPGLADDLFLASLISEHGGSMRQWYLGAFSRGRLGNDALRPFVRNMSAVPAILGNLFVIGRIGGSGATLAGATANAFAVARAVSIPAGMAASNMVAQQRSQDWSRREGVVDNIFAGLSAAGNSMNPSYGPGRGTLAGLLNAYVRETPTLLQSWGWGQEREITRAGGAIVLESSTHDGAKDTALKFADIIHDITQ